MIVVVAYDVSTETKEGRRRLRRVAQACKDYGQRVQKSVFECVLRPSDWVKLKDRLLRETALSEDSLRFYFLDEAARTRTEHHGVNCPVDIEGPLIV
jgi:CRISPR-associated protein Cas2